MYELEALPPEAMLSDLKDCIASCLDIELFNREVEAEHQESVYLDACRKTAAEALKELQL